MIAIEQVFYTPTHTHYQNIAYNDYFSYTDVKAR